jgi:CheY-like chemotaxis protein
MTASLVALEWTELLRELTLFADMGKILIVEDEEFLREAFEMLLKTEGFDVYIAENGKVGLAKLAKIKPDVVLLDIIMPVMNGVEFLKQADLRQNYPNTKVIVMSNLSDPIAAPQTKSYGVYRTIIKANLSPLDLVRIVKSVTKGVK